MITKKERKRDKKDLQRERKSDSWRNTDTQKEKQRKLGSHRRRANKPESQIKVGQQRELQTDGQMQQLTKARSREAEAGGTPEDSQMDAWKR